MTTATFPHNDPRMERAIRTYAALLDALLGAQRAAHAPFDLDLLVVFYQLADAERWPVEDLVERLAAARAARQYTVVDVAAKFQVSPSQVTRWARSGELGGRKSRGQWVFTAAEIDRFLAICAARAQQAVGQEVRPC